MVFATAFDPSAPLPQNSSAQQSPHHRQSSHQPDSTDLHPARQTNYLIARAAQARRVPASTMIENRAVENDSENSPKSGVENAEHLGTGQHLKSVDGLDSAESNVLTLVPTPLARRVQSDELIEPSSVLAPVELPKQPRLPLGLRLLHGVQQGSTVLTGLLVTSALVVYGSSVYIDRSTNQAMAQLNALQSESQQLTTANESIKQSLAEQAVKEDSGLTPYQPDDMLFIEPEPRRADTAEAKEKESERLQPLGY